MLINAIDWLLEEENPAIKYRTLVDIYDSDSTEEIKALYNSVWEDKTVIRMLNKQGENGLYDNEKKYYGSFVSLRYLTAFAEYGLQKDSRIDSLAIHTVNILKLYMEDDPSGCATPLILRALIMLGYHERDDVMILVNKFATSQLYDGGFMCKRLLDKKPERKSCYKASVAGLLLHAECKKKGIMLPNTDKLLHYFLKRDIFYTSDKLMMFTEDGRFGWRFIDNFFPVEPMRMGLPLIVSALSILGVGNHPALSKAWEILKEKENKDGQFLLDGTLIKQPCTFGAVGKPNKWLTFYVMLAEKCCGK